VKLYILLPVYDFSCEGLLGFSAQIKSADLEIIAVFRRAYSPYQSYKCERFVLDKANEPDARWLERPSTGECSKHYREYNKYEALRKANSN
jgi:hypothetical protein